MKSFLRKATPAPLWSIFQKINRKRKTWLFDELHKRGYVAVRKADFYSPLPIVEDIIKTQHRWNKPSALVGLEMDLEKLKRNWENLSANYREEYEQLPPYEQIRNLGYGVGYPRSDARTLYYMIRALKPKKYIEIGSGVSTYYTHLAAQKNESEGHSLSIKCIEPYPKPNFYKIQGIEMHKNFVQDIPLTFFDQLESGDVLFIDSSHAAKIDSDVVYELLEIVPRLKKGVYVHIHDIPFPYNFPYPAELYIFNKEEPQLWNEAYFVQAFLAFNNAFEIIQCMSYVNHYDPEFVKQEMPDRTDKLEYRNIIGSIWLKRI